MNTPIDTSAARALRLVGESDHRVVVVGAGFGGLAVLRRLEGTGVDVTLIDKRNHHTFQPLLYQVATAGLDANDISYPTRRLARGKPRLTSIQGEVVDVDFADRTLTLADGRLVEYDSLVLAPAESPPTTASQA